MKIYFTPSECIDDSKAFLLAQRLMDAAKQLNIDVALDINSADMIIELSYYFERNVAYKNKKIFVVDPEVAFETPVLVLENALKHAKSYDEFLGKRDSKNNIKNIIVLTAQPKNGCPVFTLPKVIRDYALKQNLNIKIEVLSNASIGDSISEKDIMIADLIFVALDEDNINLNKFKGKPMYKTSTSLALNNISEEIQKALKDARIYTGDHKTVKVRKNSETKYGKCAVKKGAHRISFLILLAIFIALLLMYLKQ